MAQLVFRCPQTGMNVQHRLEDLKPCEPQRVYEQVVCKACTRIHFLNRATGKLVGDDR